MKKIILTSFLFLLVATGVFAQTTDNLSLSVSPQIFNLSVFPGQTLQEKILLTNTSPVPLPILAKVTDFTADDYTGQLEFDDSQSDPIVSSKMWFDVQNPNFILQAGEQKEIDFTISVPKDAEPGGHYSAILFEPQLPDYDFQPGSPKTVPIIGVLFEFSVENLSLNQGAQNGPLLKIIGFNIPSNEKINFFDNVLGDISSAFTNESLNIVNKTPSTFELTIKNDDIYHHKISGNLLVYDSFGNVVGESTIPDTTILPGKIRQFPVKITASTPSYLKFLPASISNLISQNTSLGKYRVVLNLNGGQNLTLNQTMNMWVFPWKTVLVLLILLVIFILLRKRIVIATKTLFKH